ncbi:hypothetical protein KQ940_08385 [Marinobacterium sp. D7]|uniref:hypothetical protein n=1 Tax=Marinobacterium ramblicola TaxID=2849041 RepID=UPI001C2D3280|nr:hypothetical protein [Marinobacterium ramblicola]MBV1788071.1 hypothetical protein [Marinobacterium ramblicola]
MSGYYPKSVACLLVIAVLTLLVAGTGFRAFSTNPGEGADFVVQAVVTHVHAEPLLIDRGGASDCATFDDKGSPHDQGAAGCDKTSNCFLEHCGGGDAPVTVSHPDISNDREWEWPRLTPQPLLMPHPPLGQPPKIF